VAWLPTGETQNTIYTIRLNTFLIITQEGGEKNFLILFFLRGQVKVKVERIKEAGNRMTAFSYIA
jgi:hypothetical protein